MAKQKTTVQEIAREAAIDVEEALLRVWDAGLDRVVGPGQLLKGSDVDIARKAVGLHTRRELASLEIWSARLQQSVDDLQSYLEAEGVGRPTRSGQLSKRQIARLHRFAPHVDTSSAAIEATEPTLGSERDQDSDRFKWEVVGRTAASRYLSVDEVEAIHAELVRDFAESSDPIEPAGVRDFGLLESAANRPLTALSDSEKYPTIEMAAAALLCGIVHNHPFHNGNKRTALVSMLTFLDANRLLLECGDDELFRLLIQLAGHKVVIDGEVAVRPSQDHLADREVMAVANWLKSRTRRVEKGERSLSWRRLRPILVSFGCVAELTGNGPGRYHVRRTIETNGKWLGRKYSKQREVRSAIQVVDDGRDLAVPTIKKVRHELELDEERGVDSIAFYDRAEPLASEFIVKYRKLLGRLARV